MTGAIGMAKPMEIKQRNALQTTFETSPRDLALARGLTEAGELYQTQVTPGLALIWKQNLHRHASAQQIEDAFKNHFRTSPLFPRPCHINDYITLVTVARIPERKSPTLNDIQAADEARNSPEAERF